MPVATPPRPRGLATRDRIRREQQLPPEAAALAAADQLGELEDAGDAESLKRLANLYSARRQEALGYRELLLAAERLRIATANYDRLLYSGSDQLAAELAKAGLFVLKPGRGSTAEALLEAGAVYGRLARQAAEAAQCVARR